MAKRLPVDVCFVLDATNSTDPVILALKDRLMDILMSFEMSNRRGIALDKKYALVAYRDPIDRPPERARADLGLDHPYDEHQFLDFGGSETLEEYLETVQAYGGGDNTEDWAGALQLALDQLAWREGSKRCIVWIADANAHGSRFSTPEEKDTHEDQNARFEGLLRDAAHRAMYFIGINVKKGRDPGCAKTLSEIRTIFQEEGGKPVTLDDYIIPIDPERGFVPPDEDLPPDLLDRFTQTVTNGMAAVMRDILRDEPEIE